MLLSVAGPPSARVIGVSVLYNYFLMLACLKFMGLFRLVSLFDRYTSQVERKEHEQSHPPVLGANEGLKPNECAPRPSAVNNNNAMQRTVAGLIRGEVTNLAVLKD